MNWSEIIKKEKEKPYYKAMIKIIKEDSEKYKIFPEKKDIFNAFKYCNYEDTKVIIIGMDPYHNDGEAHGLAFSVNHGIKIPPSLRNIFKELESDLNIKAPNHGNLSSWANQGVLLLNAALTVRKNEPGSHQSFGWNIFTDNIISNLNNKNNPCVFILWGNFAKKKKNLIDDKKHLILESAHPSPLSAYNGFFGSKPFSKANNFLTYNNIEKINWRID